MLIKGRSVTLRAPEMADVDLLNKWSNDPELWRGFIGWHFPYSKRSTAEWISSRKDNDQTHQVLCIEAPDVGLIGTISLTEIDWKNRTAFHSGILLGDVDLRGKGYALDAVHALMRFAFDEMGLERLSGEMIAENTRSLKFYTEKLGWKVEGTRPSWFFRDGKRHDKVMIGITRKDYQELLATSRYWSKQA